MKKKGFTLIELLAVIVILAVIALIATPLIMNVINDAKKNSFKDSAYGIIKAVELRAMQEMQNAEGSNPPYKVDVTGNGITYSGDRPTSGWAYVDANGNIKLYMKNGSYCAYKEASSQEVTLSTTPGDCDTEIGTISSSSATELGESTGPVVPPTPTTGYSYEPKTGDETYTGILYLDPTDLSATCNAELAVANKQGQDINGNATLTGTKTGCMKWFAFGDDGNGNPTTAILDHNTTALAVYDFDNKNSEANGRIQNDYEADWHLAQDTSNWNSSLSARFPTADEIASAGGITGFSGDTSTSGVYFGGGNSATQNGKYWWLYTNLNGVESYNGQGNDNNSYQYINSSGSTSSGSMYAYWTSSIFAGSNDGRLWIVNYRGYMYGSYAYISGGVRPVISLSSLSLSN